MNNAIYRSGNLQNVLSLDANIIQESDIIYGPGYVVYGSDALGGVMDFHSKKVKLSEDSSVIYNMNAMARYASANTEKTGHFDFSFGNRHRSPEHDFLQIFRIHCCIQSFCFYKGC